MDPDTLVLQCEVSGFEPALFMGIT